MKKSFLTKNTFAIAMLVVCVTSMNSFGQWSNNPYLNTIICVEAAIQGNSAAASDGNGGAIICWADTRTDDGDIYAQRIDVNGVIQWTANGISISSAVSAQALPSIISDGTGGAIVAWADIRNGNDFDIYAQRVNGSGIVQWAAGGVKIAEGPANQVYPTLASDGNGGAFITWGSLDGMDNDIFVQGINANGTLKGSVVVICDDPDNQVQPAIISDGDGGAILTWKDGRNASDNTSAADIFAQRINANGIIQWTTNGVAVCEAPRTQENAVLISDGSEGAIITWQDERNVSVSATNVDIYAQHITANGLVQWGASGMGICTAPDPQYHPVIATDQAGGAIIAWGAYAGAQTRIAVQRVSGSGTKLWMSDGVPIGGGGKQFPIIQPDSNGGAFLTWEDSRSSAVDVYAQHLDANGTELWMPFGGVVVSNSYGTQTSLHLVADNQGGAIVAWDDYRDIQIDIYAQHIMADGSAGGANVVGNQAITFDPIPEKKFSDAHFSPGAIASSNLAVTYTSSNLSVATVDGLLLTITGVGTSTITAHQEGNANFTAAPPVSQLLTVVKGDQVITFNPLPSKTPDDVPFTLNATASSDLAVSYSSSNTGVATVSEGMITIVGMGTTNITASQAGNANFLAAVSVVQPLTVKASQLITFSALPDKTVGDPAFELVAVSTSNLPVSFSSLSDKITIAGSQVSVVKAGSVTIKADQAGNATFGSAPQVTQTFCIHPAKPVITVTGLDTEAPVLTSSSTTGNQWFKEGVAISGATLPAFTVAGEGVYTVVVSADNCASVPSDEKTFIVTALRETDGGIKIYPNPMETQLLVDVTALKSTTPVALVIYDALGRVVHSGTGNGKINIDVERYPPGLYLLKVQNGNQVTMTRLKK